MPYKIKQGLELPISGTPENTIYPGHKVSTVAVLGNEYVGMRPSMSVSEGDMVKRGPNPVFRQKKIPV